MALTVQVIVKICKYKTMHYMSIISSNMLEYVKITCAYHMHKYVQNMHIYAKPNMHKYDFSKYAQTCVLYGSTNMHYMLEYA